MIDYKYSEQRGALHEAPPAGPQASYNLDAIPPEVLQLVPTSIALAHEVLPVAVTGRSNRRRSTTTWR